MKTDYCVYPPQLAADVEITEQIDGERTVFIAGAGSVGRYILLRETEYKVFGLLDGSLAPGGVCDEFKRRHGGTLPLATLVKFLTKLDEYGILTGHRISGYAPDGPQSQQAYIRFKLFDPDPLFSRVTHRLRWIWTTGFFIGSLGVMLVTLLFALMNWAEVASYGGYILREHYIAVIVATLIIGFTHEFAHGLTCKAFGGRATEVGVLLVYYFLPALYCNVSGLHFIPERGRRLWVIAAGVYWQLMVGTAALIGWFLLAPYTLLSDLAFIFFFGSVLDVFFNGNPLIKLDGYYFLSQFLRLPNLMDRSRVFWRTSLRFILFGEREREAAKWNRREQAIYAVYGLLSFVYITGLTLFILSYVGEWLVNRFYLPGLLLTAGIALFFVRRPIKQIALGTHASLRAGVCRILASMKRFSSHSGTQGCVRTQGISEDDMAIKDQTTTTNSTDSNARRFWSRRRLVPISIALLLALVLLMPWRASVGNYGALIAAPNQEVIIRAPESATLIALGVQPGDRVARGASIGRMGNLELEEKIVEVQSELARVKADYDRLLGELRTHEETAARAELQVGQRRRDLDEIESERRQIATVHREGIEGGAFRVVQTSLNSNYRFDSSAARYPAALAVLQSDVDLRQARFEEATTQLGRARKLFADGITARSELDAVETRAKTLALELAGARDRLEAALTEHRRKYATTTTEMNLARSDAGAERLQIEKFRAELHRVREVVTALEARRDVLQRKQAQFELLTPKAGGVFGEDLPRMVGQFFQKGAEICRVTDTNQLLLRMQVPEREIGDVRAGHPVRLKTRSFPDRTFRGIVSKIGGESEQDQSGQATYRVELTIDNTEGLLRPGMTAFARIDFDRQMVGRILLHKIKQALRPELWIL